MSFDELQAIASAPPTLVGTSISNTGSVKVLARPGHDAQASSRPRSWLPACIAGPAVATSVFGLVTVMLAATLSTASPPTASSLALSPVPASGTLHSATGPVLSDAQAKADYSKLSSGYEANVGQAGPSVAFINQGGGYTSLLTKSGQVLVTMNAAADGAKGSAKNQEVSMGLVGSNPHPTIKSVGRLPGVTNYLIGSNPANWHTDISSYSSVSYGNVYPGVNLLFNQSQLGGVEYELDLAPGVSPAGITFAIKGAKDLSINRSGELVISVGGERITQPKPTIYSQAGSSRLAVSGGFVLKGHGIVGFGVGPHKATLPLVIDPTLAYSTSFGGSGSDTPRAIAVDSIGDAYVTGSTSSTDFPVMIAAGASSVPQSTCGTACTSGTDAFVSELNPTGTALVYSTYLGGTGSGAGVTNGTGIAVSAMGSVYVAGTTSASDFPTSTTAYQGSCAATPCTGSGFVAELGLRGGSLAYSTYLGGSGTDSINAMALGANGEEYVTGATTSVNFPLSSHAYQTTCASGCQSGDNGFVSVINPTASGSASLVYSSYLGASAAVTINGIAVDTSGNAYVAGFTHSSSFPSKDPLTPTCNDSPCAFVSEFNPAAATSAASLVYSTTLGGTGMDDSSANGVAVDSSGAAYVVGETNDPTFPTTTGAFQTTCQSLQTCLHDFTGFVTKIAPGGGRLAYSTFLGGVNSVGDDATRVAVDGSGDAYVIGTTNAPDFPTLNALETTCGVCFNVPTLTELNPSGSGLEYSTYLQAQHGSLPAGLAVDAAGDVYLTAASSANSSNAPFPTTDSLGTPGSGVVVEELAGPASAVPALVASLAPSSGPSVGGTTVSITGAGLANTSAVFFGSVPAASFTQASATEVTAVSPPESGTNASVSVSVVTGTGTSIVDPGFPPEIFSYGEGNWALTGSLPNSLGLEGSPTATLLEGPACAQATPSVCGEVLVTGGSIPAVQTGAKLYDPTTGAWSVTGSMNVPRSNAKAVLLDTGDVLVAGGSNGDTSEVYNPATGTFSTPVSMAPSGAPTAPNYHFTATLLSGTACAQASPSVCGDVLVAGGSSSASNAARGATTAAELYNPLTKTWSATAPMGTSRLVQSATLLPDGDVLVAGGYSTDVTPPGATQSAELYDPATASWTPTNSPMVDRRAAETATLLTGPTCTGASGQPGYCGEVLIAGGTDGAPLSTSELYNPSTGLFSLTGNLVNPHDYQSASLLPDGLVLVTGGTEADNGATALPPTADTELYNPVTATWSEAVPMSTARSGFASSLLANGTVLAVAGENAKAGTLSSAEVFTGPPTVTSVVPASGPAGGGTSVTITGEGFTNETAVDFVGTPGSAGSPATKFTINSDTKITATTPSLPSGGTGVDDVVVTGFGGRSLTSSEDQYTYGTAAASPSNLSFGPITVGLTSAVQTVTLTNSGNSALSVGSVTLGGTNASEFTTTANACNAASVAIGDTCTIGVTFTPSGSGSASASLSITDTATTSPQTVTLSGTGTTTTPITTPTTSTNPTGSGQGSASPTSLSFGPEAVGSTTTPQTATLTNTGTVNLNVTSVTVGGTNAAEFTTSSNGCAGASLAPKAACTIGVSYAPTAAGSASASLSFNDSATNSPQTVALSGSSSTVAIVPRTTPVPLVALSGTNRIETAIAVSKQSFPTAGSAKAVVLARDDDYPDALAGAPLAAAKDGPLLLSETATLDPATKAEIQRVLPAGDTVYLLGGTSALSPALATALSGLGYQTIRISGPDRFSTAVAIAEALGSPSHIYEVTGTNYPDAISAGPAAVADHGAILLTNGSNQDIVTYDYLHAHPSDIRVAVGGPAAAADPGATAVVGANRFDTSEALAALAFPTPSVVGIATGLDFPDALAGAPLLGADNGPILLVSPTTPLPASVAGYLSAQAHGVSTIFTLGGSAAVGTAVTAAAQAAVDGT